MLIKFEAKDGANFVMLQDVAVPLLNMMGTRGVTKGAVSGQELSSALEKLKSALKAHTQTNTKLESSEQDENDESEEQEVPLSARAAPLLQMLEQARKDESFCMWGPE